MNELHLFAGAGGGCLSSVLLGHRIVGYVEKETYPQEVIKARIRDGCLDAAPIFGDIKRFISEGYAASYTGLVDIVSGGFPCSPWSIAGRQQGSRDDRNLWPETMECIRLVRPRYAFLENVPNLAVQGYIGTILGDLAVAGFNAEWNCFSCCQMGGAHMRKRMFILAYTDSKGLEGIHETRLGINLQSTQETFSRDIWHSDPGVYRKIDGMGRQMDRVKAIGNGQVPAVAAFAFVTLARRIAEIQR